MTSSDDPVPISERVRFWEEQDRINQELIPRVIRQHELLTEHIVEHDNLPSVVANAIQQTIAEAREEQRQQYEFALETAKAEFTERASKQQKQYETALESARVEYNEQAGNQRQQYEFALETAKAEFTERTLEIVSDANRKTRNVFMGITAGIGVLVIILAAVVSILI